MKYYASIKYDFSGDIKTVISFIFDSSYILYNSESL